jgi:hypothetical protein
MNSNVHMSRKRYLTVIFGLVILIVSMPVAFGYVSSSTSYRIQNDSINIGGTLSTSTGYRVEDTVGEDMSGVSASASYNIKAGYQQMQQTYLAVSAPGNVTLSPNIPATGGGAANGQAIWTIVTDNISGYTASLSSTAAPALVSGANIFSDYTVAGVNPDFSFSVLANTSEFGFSPEGTDVSSRYRDDGANCNAGVGETADRCWDPLQMGGSTVALRTIPNNPSGSSLTVKFRAESGASNVQAAGSYTATATLTVLAR